MTEMIKKRNDITTKKYRAGRCNGFTTSLSPLVAERSAGVVLETFVIINKGWVQVDQSTCLEHRGVPNSLKASCHTETKARAFIGFKCSSFSWSKISGRRADHH